MATSVMAFRGIRTADELVEVAVQIWMTADDGGDRDDDRA